MSSGKEIQFLGTGTSTGIPVLTCDCHVCTSSDIRDRRSRVSMLLRGADGTIVMDTSPDFREQALRSELERIDAIFITHDHNDHIGGLDDVRIYNFRQKSPIPLFSDGKTLLSIRKRFSYIFEDTQVGGGKPSLTLTESPFFQETSIVGFQISAVPLRHGNITINGYVIDRTVAFLTDCSEIPDETMRYLHGIPILVIGAVKKNPHPTHFSFDQARDAARRLGAKATYFTHISHDLSHYELEQCYGDEIRIPVDGDLIRY